MLSKSNIALKFPIIGSHISRIGLLRTTAGGFPMYWFLPTLVFVHAVLELVFFQWIAKAVFGTARLRQKDFIILDRHRIAGIPFIDKLNCLYCGYANGLCVLLNRQLDQLQQVNRIPVRKRLGLEISTLIFVLPAGVIFELSFQLVYNILVARILGMHRMSMKEAAVILGNCPYSGKFPALSRRAFCYLQNALLRFSMALEQIESAWCPLRHYAHGENIVYPAHHSRFFRPHEIDEMRRVLSETGTVSERKPTW